MGSSPHIIKARTTLPDVGMEVLHRMSKNFIDVGRLHRLQGV